MNLQAEHAFAAENGNAAASIAGVQGQQEHAVSLPQCSVKGLYPFVDERIVSGRRGRKEPRKACGQAAACRNGPARRAISLPKAYVGIAKFLIPEDILLTLAAKS